MTNTVRSQQLRAEQLFQEHRDAVNCRTDRVFAGLMLFQWLAGIAGAFWVSPRAWAGSSSGLHMHVWLAILLGGAITIAPVALAITRPGKPITRHTIGVCQALMSALLIHLTGGRIETHFHVFGSLAFLSFYRDWKVLLSATIVVAADHFLRGFYVPISVYGVLEASPWRWLEHAGWVLFEDVFLTYSCIVSIREMRGIAMRQAQIEATNDIIESQVVERTEQLAVARDEALSALRVKSEFLANMSHEIRTPMNGVIGMTELMLGTELDEDQREFAETIRGSADMLLTVLNDILDFSKIEAGRMQLERVSFDPRAPVHEVLELLARGAQQKGLEIAGLVHHDVPRGVLGDPVRLRQVLTNLVGNAIKFTERGEVTLTLRVESTIASRACLCFTIEDSGIGIPAEARDRLFKEFSQADGSTTRKYGGTGLGLAICKRLVELMEGEIGVDSTPGAGSKFWVRVPFEVSVPHRSVSNERSRSLEGVRVLVVDDNLTNRRILELQLKAWGMRVELVADARGALTLLRSAAANQAPYELALLDLGMPQMDGFQLAEQIRSDPAIARTKLVLLSSMVQRSQLGEVSEHGFMGYLTKPLRESKLFDCLVAVLTQEPGAEPEPRAPLSSTGTTKRLVTSESLTETRLRVRRRVLLAEDNMVNRKVVVRMLEKFHYVVDIATDGAEALDAIARNPYAVVFMDCQMPGIDGLEATRQLRAREAGTDRHQTVIALTAHAMAGDAERCIAAGMDDYLTKPVSSADLMRVLAKWVGAPAAA